MSELSHFPVGVRGERLTLKYVQVQVWLAPLPVQSGVGTIANRGQWEMGCNLPYGYKPGSN